MTGKRPPRFFVPSAAITGERALLRGAERHHLRVRRLRPGARVELFDDLGRIFEAVVNGVTDEQIELTVNERHARDRESPLDLTLAIAVLKADKIDLVVEKATELGVAHIVVFTCRRALGGSGRARLERWQRIAVSAAKQCGRRLIPDIEGPEPLSRVAERSADLKLVCWEDAAAAGGLPPGGASSVLLAVGPEGGFTIDEIAELQRAGFHAVSLGPRILRGETAAIAAAAIVQQRWGDLGARLA